MLKPITDFIEKIKTEVKQVRFAKITLIVCGITIVCLWIYGMTSLVGFIADNVRTEKAVNPDVIFEEPEVVKPSPSPKMKIMVHLKGAVKTPGLYALPANSRLGDAVRLAGGTTENAAVDYINLAQFLTDGSDIYIPTVQDIANDTTGKYKKQVSPPAQTTSSSSGSGKQTPAVKVNINTADVAQLCTLPGVGESTANAIITYRERMGGFKSASEIMEVKGISDSKYQDIKDYIVI